VGSTKFFRGRVLAGHHFAGVNMMALRYRLTFIDVEMELPGGAGQTRSKSCPPVPGVMPETGDFWANEAGYHGHVKTLANRAEELMLEMKSTSSPVEIEETVLPSLGSYGHPELCRRPCLFWVQKKECVKGASCPFCHEDHEKLVSLDKAQRSVIARLSDSEKIFLLLPLLRTKVQQGWTEAKDVLELLQGSHVTEVHFDAFPRKTMNSLVKVMERMSLMGLLGVLSKYIADEPLAEQLEQAIHRLRPGEGRSP